MAYTASIQKILVIEDSTTIHLMIRSLLQDEGLELLFAGNGVEGFRLAVSESPDLILLDVEMPDPNGFEVCRRLKAEPATIGIPVIFLTGVSSTADKVRGLDLGAVDYVTKPFDPAELCARVRASLRNKYMLDLLARKAMIDGLTGMWNRTYLDQRLAAEVALARRHGRPFAAIMADVDRFKFINDTHGHPFGDQVLRHVAEVIATRCRSEDIACRYGGEEFAILTPMVAMTGARSLAEELCRLIREQAIPHRGSQVRITCSFGVAEMNPLAPDALVETADARLYRAKQSGRNCVVWTDSDTSSLTQAAVAVG